MDRISGLPTTLSTLSLRGDFQGANRVKRRLRRQILLLARISHRDEREHGIGLNELDPEGRIYRAAVNGLAGALSLDP